MALYGGSLYGGSINLFWRLTALYERNFKKFLIYLNKQQQQKNQQFTYFSHCYHPTSCNHQLVFLNFLDFTCKKTIWYLSSSD